VGSLEEEALAAKDLVRMPALGALIVSPDDALSRGLAESLRWVGAENIVRLRHGRAALDEAKRHRFAYKVVVVHIEEHDNFDVEFIEQLLRSRDQAFRSLQSVAVVRSRSREFLAEIHKMGFSSVVTLPLNQNLFRASLARLFAALEAEYRRPDTSALRRALNNGDLDFVEERCAMVLGHDPKHHLAMVLWGEACFRRGRFEEAREWAQKALDTKEDSIAKDARRLFAKSCFALNRTEEAFAAVGVLQEVGASQMSSCVQGMIPILNAYASSCKAQGQFEAAIACYRAALTESDGRQYERQLYLNMALACLASGDVRAAYVAASRSAAASGASSKARELLAHIEKTFSRDEYDPRTVREAEPAPDAVLGLVTSAEQEPRDGGVASLPPETVATQSSDHDLTEEVDLPAKTASLMPPPVVAEEPSLDDVGHDFDLGLGGDATDFSFDVSAADVESARLERERMAALAAELQVDLPSVGDERMESGLGSALEDALGVVAEMMPSQDLEPESSSKSYGVQSSGDSFLAALASQREAPAAEVAASKVPGKKADEAPQDKARVRWDLMPEDKILQYLLFRGEHPDVKVKPLKVQPTVRLEILSGQFGD
jgi:tetratricopeptide (TPR) repeat protein